jgi:hypothetical protein
MVAIGSFLTALFGCSEQPGDLGPGEACLRTVQCGPGLACSAGLCTTDLSLLGMNAMVPDSGPAEDAGMGVDAGDVDAGMVGMDAGPRPDAGMVRVDAGEPDAGRPDAGPPAEPDAGGPDAGP